MKSILFFIFLFTGIVWSQNSGTVAAKKITVAVLPLDAVALTSGSGLNLSGSYGDTTQGGKFTGSGFFRERGEITAFADAATQKVVNAFVNLKRIRVIERTQVEKIIKEQDFMLSDMAQTNESVKMGSLLGAEYIVLGQIQQLSVVTHNDTGWTAFPSDGFIYEGTVELGLRLISVTTGEVIASKNLKGGTGFLYQKTPAEAAYKALGYIEKEVADWLRMAFPAEGIIVEISKQKKGEAKEVVINCGKDLGIRKDDIFKVFYETEVEIDGAMVKKSTDIGKLVVTKVEQDGTFSRCEVDKGGKAIAEKIAAGIRLKAVQVKK
jgi:hypothetical protein